MELTFGLGTREGYGWKGAKNTGSLTKFWSENFFADDFARLKKKLTNEGLSQGRDGDSQKFVEIVKKVGQWGGPTGEEMETPRSLWKSLKKLTNEGAQPEKKWKFPEICGNR